MGVPTFFRWLLMKYPKIVSDILEKKPFVVEGVDFPVDASEPNPNNVEYDNLYIDMNGLIHPCCHSEERETPSSEGDMYINIFKYIDRLFNCVRPRRVLFLAIDGVAPRAKMNQQRSRRFKAAKESKERQEMLEEVKEEMRAMGVHVPEHANAHWDSNVITPGTPFMTRLAAYLHFYVLHKMNTNKAWRNLKVFISDASEPGEGEHKIMNFVRAQRNTPGFDPNQRHILHGLDADLIMLALATHEPYFTILREKVDFGPKHQKTDKKSDAQKLLDASNKGEGLRTEDEWLYQKPLVVLQVNTLREYLTAEFACLERTVRHGYNIERVIDDFVFMCFFVGNDFLPHLPSLDIREGALDFLIECYKQMLPSLGDYLTSPGGNINLRQVDVILGRVGEIEDQVFRLRKESEDADAKQLEEYKRHNAAVKAAGGKQGFGEMLREQQLGDKGMISIANTRAPVISLHSNSSSSSASGGGGGSNRSINYNSKQPAAATISSEDMAVSSSSSNSSNADAARKLKESLNSSSNKKKRSQPESEAAEDVVVEVEAAVEESSKKLKTDETLADDKVTVVSHTDLGTGGDVTPVVDIIEEAELDGTIESGAMKIGGGVAVTAIAADLKEELKQNLKLKMDKKRDDILAANKTSVVDHVRLHEHGWKDRYYGDKFKKEDVERGGGKQQMFKSYVEGLCWVLKYYYEGCPSWNWFYPFHYAPFASDLVNIDTYDISFTKSLPFRPIEQLLSVLPSTSASALPTECQGLMLDYDSPIFDIYIDNAETDPNGKFQPHQFILLLPFIDETRINEAFATCKESMSMESRMANQFGHTTLFIHKDHAVMKTYLAAQEYVPGSETDAEVLSALGIETKKPERYEDLLRFPSDPVEFDCTDGGGLCGAICKPLKYKYAAVGETIKCSKEIADAASGSMILSEVTSNAVACLTYVYPKATQHKSELLPGVKLPKPELSGYDLVEKRPPRLSRSQFNMYDMLRRSEHRNHHGEGSSFQAQQQHNGFSDRRGNRDNRDNRGSYNNNHNNNYNNNQNNNNNNSYNNYNNNRFGQELGSGHHMGGFNSNNNSNNRNYGGHYMNSSSSSYSNQLGLPSNIQVPQPFHNLNSSSSQGGGGGGRYNNNNNLYPQNNQTNNNQMHENRGSNSAGERGYDSSSSSSGGGRSGYDNSRDNRGGGGRGGYDSRDNNSARGYDNRGGASSSGGGGGHYSAPPQHRQQQPPAYSNYNHSQQQQQYPPHNGPPTTRFSFNNVNSSGPPTSQYLPINSNHYPPNPNQQAYPPAAGGGYLHNHNHNPYPPPMGMSMSMMPHQPPMAMSQGGPPVTTPPLQPPDKDELRRQLAAVVDQRKNANQKQP